MRETILILLLALSVQSKPIEKAKVKETPRYEVISEWVRVITAIRIHQEKYEQAMSAAKAENDKPLATIGYNHAMNIELRSSIPRLKAMKVSDEHLKGTPTHLAFFFVQKVKLQSELIVIKKKSLVDTPQPGVDYTKLLGRLPEISVEMDNIDRAIVQLATMFCAMLIDTKPNSLGKLDHLLVTKAQRDNLIRQIDLTFGDDLTWKPGVTYNTAAASSTRTFLVGGHRSSDEPWD